MPYRTTSVRRDLPSILLLAAMAGASAWAWSRAPDVVPTHWGLTGEIDGHGPKALALLLVPAIAAGLLAFLRWLHAGIGDTRALAATRALTVGFFGVLHAKLVASSVGAPVDLSGLVWIGLGALFVGLACTFPYLPPNSTTGIRTAHTLGSDLAWRRTHRVGAVTFGLVGVVTAVAGWLHPALGVAALVAGNLANLVFVSIYAARVWQEDPDRRMP
jgi:uncharacterized membrane protein